MSVVAVGACYVDTILTTSHYPSEDEKLRASKVARRRGGNCPNTLEVLQQLVGHQSTENRVPLNLVAVLPAKDSVASQQIRSAFEPRVSLAHCLYREQCEEPASSYIIKSQSTSSRTIVNYNELREMTLEEFSSIAEELGPKSTWFHFERVPINSIYQGRIPDVTLSCIQYLRQHFPDVRISVEAEKPGRPGLQELADAADMVFYSKSWAQSNGYTSMDDCLKTQATRLPRKLLCCTWGADGAGMYDPDTSITTVPAWKGGCQVVDTIGAGDTFIAGMLYAMNCKDQEWDNAHKLMFANQVAGLKVLQEGFAGLDRAFECMANA